MEGEGEEEVGLAVLARASDLRSRISACAAAAAARPPPSSRREPEEAVEYENGDEEEEEEQGEEEVKSLVGISDALESLERQLAALQDLQHQQRYEGETMLTHIDRSRRLLLRKLKEHKGRPRRDREVIREAAAFAGEKMDHHHDEEDGLVLPPYSTSRVTSSFVLDDLYPLNFHPSKSKHSQRGLEPDGMNQDGTGTNGLGNRGTGTTPSSNHGSRLGGGGGGIGSFIGWLARTAVMVAGAVSIVVKAAAAAGYDPAGIVRNNNVNKLDIVGATTVCPPGKVMVVFDGEEDHGGRGGARCVVKERVVVPFVADLQGSPSASYGLG